MSKSSAPRILHIRTKISGTAVYCGRKVPSDTPTFGHLVHAQSRVGANVQPPCAKCLKAAIAAEAKRQAELVALPAMDTSPARTWSWPKPISQIRELMSAIRGGFELVELPLPQNAPASASPRYGLRRDGLQAPGNVLSGITVANCRQRGLIERDDANQKPDGSIPFRLGPLAR